MGAPDVNFARQYSDMVQLLLQQKTSKLRNTVLIDTNFNAEYKFYDQLGTSSLEKRISRFAATPIINANHDRRRLSQDMYEGAHLEDTWDKLNMIIDPTNPYTQSLIRAANRKIDSVICAAAIGTAYSGKEGGTSESVTNTVTASSGLTVDKLLDTLEYLRLADVDDDEELYFACTWREIKDLLNTTEVKSSDYNTVKALAAGQVDSFMGFKFVVTNQVTRTSSVDYCYAYCKSGIMLGISKDIGVRVDERADLSYAKQVYVALALGAVRLEDEKVVAVNVTNA